MVLERVAGCLLNMLQVDRDMFRTLELCCGVAAIERWCSNVTDAQLLNITKPLQDTIAALKRYFILSTIDQWAIYRSLPVCYINSR